MITKLHKNEQGVAAIVIVMAIIIVTSLIVSGFSNIIQREQRQALDQQLKVQSRLAAESVINKRTAEYRSNPQAFSALYDTGLQECVNVSPDNATFDTVAKEITTICEQINVTPSSLEFDELSAADSTVVWLNPGNLVSEKIIITWERPESEEAGGECLNRDYSVLPSTLGNGASPAISSGQAIDMIRFDLIAAQSASGASFSRSDMQNNLFGGILYPLEGGSALKAYNPSDQAVIFGACSGTAETDLTGLIGGSFVLPDSRKAYAVIDIAGTGYEGYRFLLRMKGVYKGALVRVYGVNYSSGDPALVPYQDAQIALEATVQTTDIVQNVQVRVPASTPPADLLPDYALRVGSGGACKLLHNYPGFTNNQCTFNQAVPTP